MPIKWTKPRRNGQILRLNQKEMGNRNRPITSNKTETVSKNLPTNKSLGPDGFTGKSYQTFREQLALYLLKLFQKIAEGGTLPNLLYETTIIILIPKSDKDISQNKKITDQYH